MKSRVTMGVVLLLAIVIAGCVAVKKRKTRAMPPPPLPPGLKSKSTAPAKVVIKKPIRILTYVPTDFALTNISIQPGNQIVLRWQNGTPPFQPQSRPSVTVPWADFGPTTMNRSITNFAPYGFTAAFFRVKSSESSAGICQRSWHFGGLGSQDSAFPTSVKQDRNGDIIVAGTFQGTVNLGGGNFTSVPVNVPDMFVAKYSVNGAHIWSKRIGGSGNDQANGLALDSANNIVVAGTYLDTVDFGGVTLTNASVGGGDIFVAKYSPTGSLIWAKRFGGTATEICKAVAIDGADAVLITGGYGFFGSSVDFGGGLLPLSGGGTFGAQYDLYVVKLSSAGAHVWSHGYGGMGWDIGNSIAVDAAKDVAVTGEFQQTASFGGAVLPNAGGHEAFIAKYSGVNGNHLWSRSGGGTGEDYGRGIAFDSSGNVIAIGEFQGTANFGGGNLVSANGNSGLFMAKYQGAGGHVWSRGFSGQTPWGIASGKSVAVDSSANILVTGGVSGAVDFDGVILGFGSSGAMIVKFTSAGNRIWANQYDGLGDDYGASVTIGSGNGVIAVGNYSSQLDFGCGFMDSPGEFDGFAVRLSP
jgi:uncharacterized protein (AIM24 family)